MKTLKKIVIGVLAYWILFVGVSWYAYFATGSVPDTLVQYGLGGGSAELLAAAGIEIAKSLADKKYGEDDSRKKEKTANYDVDLINLDEDGEING